MLNPITSSPTWSELAGYGVAIFIALSGWYTAIKNRKKPKSDIGLQDAQREKASAEALETIIRINGDAFKRIERLEKEKAELQQTVMTLRDENRRLRGNGRA